MKHLLLLLLLILTGCSQVSIEEDFKSYSDSIVNNQQELADNMNTLLKENSNITDFKKYSQEKFLPFAKDYLNKTTSLHPQTEELSKIHEKYIQAVQLNFEVLSSISDLADQKVDTAKKEVLLKKLEKSQKLVIEWKDSMDNIAHEYNVTLKKIDIDFGGGMFLFPSPSVNKQ